MSEPQNLLDVTGLKTYFYIGDSVIKSVDDVSFSLQKGKTLGIVGESGCGKSVTSLSILRLVEGPAGRIVGGTVCFHGTDLLEKTEKEMENIRGGKIAMVFQEPMTSLNPVYTIGNQLIEAIRLHNRVSRQKARKQALEMLELVKIPLPEKRIDEYPHELSGGMRQRVMIAMALCCKPDLLICDEPTTALDVTIQAQILELIRELQKETETAVMMITHDLGVIAEIADDVMVMYAGKIVEYSDADTLFENPRHPYTIGLLECIPRVDRDQEALRVIPGMVPSHEDMPRGCAFSPRCGHARDICRQQMPDLIHKDGYQVRCFKYGDQWEGAEP
ncbi:oligopeptide transport ATP-binding protein AppD [Treponema primitia ZAS-2]|uniref:Oligopeptide transport ATP-binding protein AppD n=1 Tax=Treponema primitia (strain ATCC BAA-887 / DSM 12427 / ZAS-2) TaxID=545694 RepID=F5YQR7_TREPZ|nr:ABC transporter ATP-binding protein [Treponema primitia]AEF84395.1 oligopeptide transport ATP-binding protein AppD [Treponema primitia ZAS-2]